MVHLTNTLLKYIPEWYHLKKTSGSYFKKQSLFYLMRFTKGREWSSHKNAMNRFGYLQDGEMFYRPHYSGLRQDYNRSRIAAGCEEHGYNYSNFVATLPKIDIYLNQYSLARLAIYEPRTFKSLVEICKAVTDEELPRTNFNRSQIQ